MPAISRWTETVCSLAHNCLLPASAVHLSEDPRASKSWCKRCVQAAIRPCSNKFADGGLHHMTSRRQHFAAVVTGLPRTADTRGQMVVCARCMWAANVMRCCELAAPLVPFVASSGDCAATWQASRRGRGVSRLARYGSLMRISKWHLSERPPTTLCLATALLFTPLRSSAHSTRRKHWRKHS